MILNKLIVVNVFVTY